MTLDRLPARLLRGAAVAALLALVPTACATAGASSGTDARPAALAAARDEGRILDLRDWGLGKVREAAPLTPGAGGSGKYLAARQAQILSDTAAAADYFVAALDRDPDNIEILRRAYFYLVAEGRIEDAVPLARRTLEMEPDSSVAPLVLAASAMADGRAAAAGEIVARLDDRGLNAFMVPMLRAWSLAGQGRHADGLKALEPLTAQPQFGDLYTTHAALIADLGGLREEAERHYQDIIAESPNLTLRSLQTVASWLLRTDRRAEAEALVRGFAEARNDSGLLDAAVGEMLEKGTDFRPVATAEEGMAEAFFGTASTIAQGNAHDTALAFVRLALHLDPNLTLARLLIGDILGRMDRLEEAVTAYGTVPEDSIGWYTARLRMADHMERLGRFDTAVGLVTELASAFPDRAEPLVVEGDIHRRNDQWLEAAAAYTEALNRVETVGREHWAWFYSRGIAYERSKQWDKAEADFKRALELEPDQPFVLNYLGYSWIDRGEHLEEGREMIERAVAQRPRDGYIVDSLGWVHFLMGNYGEAVTHLERAVELSPADPTINDHLGDAYWRVGRKTEARFQWRRALDMGPEEPGQADRLRDKIANGLPDAAPGASAGQ